MEHGINFHVAPAADDAKNIKMKFMVRNGWHIGKAAVNAAEADIAMFQKIHPTKLMSPKEHPFLQLMEIENEFLDAYEAATRGARAAELDVKRLGWQEARTSKMLKARQNEHAYMDTLSRDNVFNYYKATL